MTIPRIYSPEALGDRKICELGADNLKYLKQVMRLKQGDRIKIFDGVGKEFEAVIKSYSAKNVLIELIKLIPAMNKEISITLAQAIPKAKKMDAIVKTAAELGTDRILPFDSARSVVRIAEEKTSLKIARWQKIAMEAARSSHSSYITQVSEVFSFSDMLTLASKDALKLIFWEEECQKTVKDVLHDKRLSDTKDFFVVVGPEGGFSKNEIAKAKESGLMSVSLGRQILKVETAVAAIISIIQYEKGIFSKKSQEAKNGFL
ncbi:MAG: 16S rRNA (uracil(1498)-N(3))-methyltransferase [Syntrophaceae bacterium]|nr:16S rRNA (uracil(1498)-N(3))-methyltransferase [Syntrophaceae bacterium]